MEKKTLDWSYLAGYFDANGSLRENKSGKGPRLRINSYSSHLLEEIRTLVDGGSISREQKPRGEYYRLDITGPEHVQRVLREISPLLRVKTVRGEEWLNAMGERFCSTRLVESCEGYKPGFANRDRLQPLRG